jgi:hypothetical protein
MDQILVIRASTAGLVFRLLSSRHKHGVEFCECIDSLTANLAEAERNEYRRAVRRVK